MNVPIPRRWRRALALGLVAFPATASAQDRDPFAPAEPQQGVRVVEVIHGTRRVWPLPKPPAPVFPAMPPRVTEDRYLPVPVDPAPPAQVSEPRTIIFASYNAPPPGAGFVPRAPWLGEGGLPHIPVPPMQPAPAPAVPAAAPVAAPAPAPAQPTVVVIREQGGDARPAVVQAEPPRGLTLGGETLLGIAIAAAGLGFGYAGWKRRQNEQAPARVITPPITNPMGDGLMLLGRYNAGPLPTTAEKFEIGPSFQMEMEEKKKVEEKNQEAVLEFILSQNLALHDELAGSEAPLPEAVELQTEEEAPPSAN